MAQNITYARLKREAQQAAFDAARKAMKPSAVYDASVNPHYDRFLYQDVLLAFAEAQHAWRRVSNAYLGRVEASPAPPLEQPLMDLGDIVGAAFLARDQEGDINVHAMLEAGSQLCHFARVFTTMRLQGAMYRMLNTGVNGNGETSLGSDVDLYGDLDDLVEVGIIYAEMPLLRTDRNAP